MFGNTRPSVNYAKDWLDHSFPFPGLVWSEKKNFTLDVITSLLLTSVRRQSFAISHLIFFSKFKTCLNLNLSLGLSRAEDGACTIEAAAAKVAVPQAQALQTPAAFSPTPESTEFDPFCSLRPQLICPGLHTQPSLARRGPWDLVPEP